MNEICPIHTEITIEYVQDMIESAQNVEEIVKSCPICTSRVRKMIDDYNKTSIFDRSCNGEIDKII